MTLPQQTPEETPPEIPSDTPRDEPNDEPAQEPDWRSPGADEPDPPMRMPGESPDVETEL